MKFYYPFQIVMSVLGLLFPVELSAGERPPSAPPVDERLDRIEYRLKKLEAAVFQTGKGIEAAEAKLNALVKGDCPCPDGVCICDGKTCKCVDCPEHKGVYGRSVNGRTVQRVGDRVACMKDGEVVLYLAGTRLDERAADWLQNPTTSYVPQYLQSATGHYETQCSGGFCRRVWVPN